MPQRNEQAGYTMSIQKCWELARGWYTGRLDYGWQRPDLEKIQQLFDSLGLEGKFWDLSSAS
ncbi:MAG: hypothetical protein JRF29_00810 [Deltaproteobacteria bacterium]|nr:hypothetical protein [Deltaproteobacteria bacterium]